MNTSKLRLVSSDNKQEELFRQMEDVFKRAGEHLSVEEFQELCLSFMENSIANIVGNAIHPANVNPNLHDSKLDEVMYLVEEGIKTGYTRGYEEFGEKSHAVFAEIKVILRPMKGQVN